ENAAGFVFVQARGNAQFTQDPAGGFDDFDAEHDLLFTGDGQHIDDITVQRAGAAALRLCYELGGGVGEAVGDIGIGDMAGKHDPFAEGGNFHIFFREEFGDHVVD